MGSTSPIIRPIPPEPKAWDVSPTDLANRISNLELRMGSVIERLEKIEAVFQEEATKNDEPQIAEEDSSESNDD